MEELAPITAKAVEIIKKYSPNGVVEIGAGSGKWLQKLRENNVIAVGYDIAPGSVVVLKGDHNDAAKHSEMTMLAVWPPDGSIISKWVGATNWKTMIICGCWSRFDYDLDLSAYNLVDTLTLPGDVKGESELRVFTRKLK